MSDTSPVTLVQPHATRGWRLFKQRRTPEGKDRMEEGGLKGEREMLGMMGKRGGGGEGSGGGGMGSCVYVPRRPALIPSSPPSIIQ